MTKKTYYVGYYSEGYEGETFTGSTTVEFGEINKKTLESFLEHIETKIHEQRVVVLSWQEVREA